jgi:hypothetical protein
MSLHQLLFEDGYFSAKTRLEKRGMPGEREYLEEKRGYARLNDTK